MIGLSDMKGGKIAIVYSYNHGWRKIYKAKQKRRVMNEEEKSSCH